MPDPMDSPAVQSMKIEQAAQRDTARKGELDKGLEDSFPASDPVSATHSSVSGGRIDVAEAEKIAKAAASNEDHPLGDEPFGSTTAGHRTLPRSHSGRHADRSFVRDANRTADQTSGTAAPAGSQAQSVLHEIETRVRANPIRVVAVVAALAFVFGATR